MFQSFKTGFSLIELVIMVLIVSVLAAVGVPVYNQYVLNAKTAEAYQTVKVISDKQRTYFLENKKFISTGINPAVTRNYGYGANWMKFVSGSSQDGWAQLGLPFTDGQPTLFRYSTQAGIGTQQVGPDGDDLTMNVNDGSENPQEIVADINAGVAGIFGATYDHAKTNCISSATAGSGDPIATPASLGVSTSQPDGYQWGIIGAQGYLVYGNEKCRYVLMVMDAAPSIENNLPRLRSGMIVIDHDFSSENLQGEDETPVDDAPEEGGGPASF